MSKHRHVVLALTLLLTLSWLVPGTASAKDLAPVEDLFAYRLVRVKTRADLFRLLDERYGKERVRMVLNVHRDRLGDFSITAANALTLMMFFDIIEATSDDLRMGKFQGEGLNLIDTDLSITFSVNPPPNKGLHRATLFFRIGESIDPVPEPHAETGYLWERTFPKLALTAGFSTTMNYPEVMHLTLEGLNRWEKTVMALEEHRDFQGRKGFLRADYLEAKQPQVRSAALRKMESLVTADDVDWLIEQAEKDFIYTDRFISLLGHVEDPPRAAVKFVEPYAENKNTIMRLKALEALCRMTDGRTRLRWLKTALEDSEFPVRHMGVRQVNERPDPRIYETLITVPSRDTYKIPEKYFPAVAKVGGEEAATFIAKAAREAVREFMQQQEDVKSSYASRIQFILQGLTDTNSLTALAALNEVFASGDERIQLLAVSALGDLDRPESLTALQEMRELAESPIVRNRVEIMEARLKRELGIAE